MWYWRGSIGVAGVCGLFLALTFAVNGQQNRRDTLEERVGERFRELDQNGDQKLTREESGFGLFRLLNADGDSFVTLSEAVAGVRKHGVDAVQKAALITVEPEQVAPLRQGPRRLTPGDHGVGRLVPNLELTAVDGSSFRLSDYSDRPAAVLAFTNTMCPLSKKYAPSLAALERDAAQDRIPFIYVNGNASDTVERIQSDIANHGFRGPYVRDLDGRVAQAVGATHTTDVIVLDARRTIVYRGAVDDQYGFEYALDAPRNEYLKLALNAVLEGRPLLVAATEAPGCPLESPEPAATTTGITYHNRISRILQSRCQECHRVGGAAPFALSSYAEAAAQGAAIRQAVERGVMPPWFASRPGKDQPSHFANDKSLSEIEKADLLSWIATGKPEGNPDDAPLARRFPDGWRIGTPDHVVQLREPLPVKATGTMPYQDVIIEAGVTEDKWVRAMEIRPTAPEVVHHVLVFLLPPEVSAADRKAGENESDGFFVAYAPGNDALVFPEGFGKRLPAGSRLKFQMHFTPNGTATADQTRVGFVFSSEPPRHLVHVSGIANPRIAIPPGADSHRETVSQTVDTPTTLLAFFPHMHLRGKAFRYEALYPDGRQTVLLDIPRYDFNWQLSYRLAEPVELPAGTILNLTAWYDNSRNNPANPDPGRTVKWGPQTEDEMMIGYIEHYATGGESASTGITTSGLGSAANLARNFQRLDKNQDGKLVESEMPADWKARLLKADADGDRAVTLEEIQTALRRRRQ